MSSVTINEILEHYLLTCLLHIVIELAGERNEIKQHFWKFASTTFAQTPFSKLHLGQDIT